MQTFGDLAELTYDAEVDGELVRRTLLVRSYERGGWATVMIAYEERAKDGHSWRRPKLALLRMRRVGDGWKKHSIVTMPADQVLRLLGDLGQHAHLFTALPDSDPGDDD